MKKYTTALLLAGASVVWRRPVFEFELESAVSSGSSDIRDFVITSGYTDPFSRVRCACWQLRRCKKWSASWFLKEGGDDDE
jgi:hypothetical protein